MVATPLTGAGNETTAVTSSASASSITVSKPANVADGDLLVASVAFQVQLPSGATMTAPDANWKILTAQPPTTGGTAARAHVIFVKPIPSAAAETATSYTFGVSSGSTGRWDVRLNRVTGADLTNPVDAAGAQGVGSTSPYTVPGVTTDVANALLILIFHMTATSAQVPNSVTTPSGWTDLGSLLHSTYPTAGSDDALYSAYRTQTAAGSTGSASVAFTPAQTTIGGAMGAIRSASTGSATGAATMSGAGTMTAAGVDVVPSDSAAMTGAGAMSADPQGGTSATATMSGTSALAVVGQITRVASVILAGAGTMSSNAAVTTIERWLALPTAQRNGAHRAAEADFPEMTMYGYAQCVSRSSVVALNVDCWFSSDGVPVASHDQTTGRVFGTDLDIPSNTWATLSTLRTTVGNQPICKVTDVLDAYGASRVIFVENKQGSSARSAFNAMLAAYPTATRNFIYKAGFRDTTGLAAAKAAGAVGAGWGYWFAGDAALITGSNIAPWDLLGLSYNADPTTEWQVMLSNAGGRVVLAHVPMTAANAQQGYTNGAQGLMTAKFVGVVPEDVPQDTAAATMTGAGTLSAGGTGTSSAAVTLTGSGTLTVSSSGTGSASVTMTGAGVLAAAGSGSSSATTAMAGTGAMSVAGVDQLPTTVTMIGTGTLLATAGGPSGAAALAGTGTLTVTATATRPATVTLAGTGTLLAGSGGSSSASVTLAGVGTLAATAVVAPPIVYEPTPPERMLTVAAENRTMVVPPQNRTVEVAS